MLSSLRLCWIKFKPILTAAHLHTPSLVDNFGRKHTYLRLSLTERCNLRCLYCMPESGVALTPNQDCLSLQELTRLADIFVLHCGVDKIRLTGGEPTLDPKLVPLLKHLSSLRKYGLNTIALTTNGMTLEKRSETYKELGLNCVNISLDTLKARKFEQITRRKGFDKTFSGLKKAIEVGFDSVKLNCVVMKNFNEDEIPDFVDLAMSYPIEVRFIEFMPFAKNDWSGNKVIDYREMRAIIESHLGSELVRLQGAPNDVSKSFRAPKMAGRVGFISSMSDHFCSGCNRLRVTADGNFKNCLFGNEETSLRDLIRNGANNAEIVKAIKSSLSRKWKQHPPSQELLRGSSRPMVKIAARCVHTESSGVGDEERTPTPDHGFSHLDRSGKARMVNVGHKESSKRVAVAEGRIQVGSVTLQKIIDGTVSKGDVLSVARVAGILGAKQTDKLIPLCHQIALTCVNISIKACHESGSLLIRSEVETLNRTGVEMESLMAVSITALTLYDMCKSSSRDMKISDIRLVRKTK